ncbi:unnamed protein product [Polarella glacialis]|uniref:Uncharacterized protein n=1 Tax=Polarella glacialis TaxID=89957 RepID=A0A813GWU0_POLGL|nr:unnamed protein product [Polarella glacialis]
MSFAAEHCMLLDLPWLLQKVIGTLAAAELPALAVGASWLLDSAVEVADAAIIKAIAATPHVTRWRRERYAGHRARVLQELDHLTRAIQYLPRVAGRYRLSHSVLLDIWPCGKFENFSIGDFHRFKGQATVAAVSTSKTASLGYIFHFDRWYSECTLNGRLLTADELDFVGPGFQCYSLSAFRDSDGALGVLMENKPFPDTVRGWDTSAGVSLEDEHEVENEEEDEDEEDEDEDEDEAVSPGQPLANVELPAASVVVTLDSEHVAQELPTPQGEPLRTVAPRMERFPWVNPPVFVF